MAKKQALMMGAAQMKKLHFDLGKLAKALEVALQIIAAIGALKPKTTARKTARRKA